MLASRRVSAARPLPVRFKVLASAARPLQEGYQRPARFKVLASAARPLQGTRFKEGISRPLQGGYQPPAHSRGGHQPPRNIQGEPRVSALAQAAVGAVRRFIAYRHELPCAVEMAAGHGQTFPTSWKKTRTRVTACDA